MLDNASPAPLDRAATAEIVHGRPLHLIRSERPLGVAAARNLLMHEAAGEILFALDDDAYFAAPDALANAARALCDHPGAGILAVKIVDRRDDRTTVLSPHSRRSLRLRPDALDVPHPVGYYLGGAHAIRRAVIDSCGGYSVHTEFGEEELDLSYRAVSAGFTLFYDPSIVVRHEPQVAQSSDRSLLARRLYAHTRNRFYLAYRYLPARYVLPYLGRWLVVYSARALRLRTFTPLLRGVADGVLYLRRVERRPLDERAVAYLRDHFGRLWY